MMRGFNQTRSVEDTESQDAGHIFALGVAFQPNSIRRGY